GAHERQAELVEVEPGAVRERPVRWKHLVFRDVVLGGDESGAGTRTTRSFGAQRAPRAGRSATWSVMSTPITAHETSSSSRMSGDPLTLVVLPSSAGVLPRRRTALICAAPHLVTIWMHGK